MTLTFVNYWERTLATRQGHAVCPGQVEYLFSTINVARFFRLKKLHFVVGEKWGVIVRLTPQICRDLHCAHMSQVSSTASLSISQSRQRA
jgi:hypothetical protein